VVCRAAAGIASRTQQFREQFAQKWPASRNVHDVNGCADFTYVPDEVLYRVGVREVIVAIEDGCEYLDCVRFVPAFDSNP
jgi:hypothetical protein